MKKDTGFKIIASTLLIYSILLMLGSYEYIGQENFNEGIVIGAIRRLPILANLLCLMSFAMGAYLVKNGD